jgi:predicted TIM-barrel fold metal-dependent hydrolase
VQNILNAFKQKRESVSRTTEPQRPLEYDSLAEVRYYLESLKLRGIKLNLALDGPPPVSALQYLSSTGAPVLVHGEMPELQLIRERLTPYLRSPLIIAHLGCHYPSPRALQMTFELMRKYPNVFADTAGIYRRDFLRQATEHFPDRLLFGSDWPVYSIELSLRCLLSCLPRPELARVILRENPQRLFH